MRVLVSRSAAIFRILIRCLFLPIWSLVYPTYHIWMPLQRPSRQFLVGQGSMAAVGKRCKLLVFHSPAKLVSSQSAKRKAFSWASDASNIFFAPHIDHLRSRRVTSQAWTRGVGGALFAILTEEHMEAAGEHSFFSQHASTYCIGSISEMY